MTLDRDAAAGEALRTDLYLDALLAGAVLDAAAGDTLANLASRLDPAARRASDRLRRDLVRIHPSFRFEERLATRLAAAAVAMRVPVAAGQGRVVAFRPGTPTDLDPGLVPPDTSDVAAAPAFGLATKLAGSDVEQARRTPTRPLLIGGALTSAALSLAGAAFVAWRLGRPGRAATPMARAARAVRDARLASLGSSAGSARRTSAQSLD